MNTKRKQNPTHNLKINSYPYSMTYTNKIPTHVDSIYIFVYAIRRSGFDGIEFISYPELE